MPALKPGRLLRHSMGDEPLRAGAEILDGLHDDLPEEAFYFAGGMDEIRARG